MLSNTQKWGGLIGGIVCIWLIYSLSTVLTPFLISLILTYLGNPMMNRLEAWHLPKVVALILIISLILLAIALALFFILPLLQDQITLLIIRIPEIFLHIKTKYLAAIETRLGISLITPDPDFIKQLFMQWENIGNIAHQLLERLSQSGRLLLVWIGHIMIISVVTCYLLLDRKALVKRGLDLIPPRYQNNIKTLGEACNAVLAEFFRGQLLIMLVQAIFYSIGLWLIGLDFSLLIGVFAGFISFIPYLGAILGFSIAMLVAIFQFQDFIHIFYILLIFGMGQGIENILLVPLLIGDRIGLHPVVVIFAVMAGGQLFGFFGILLAVPFAAISMILLRFLLTQYLHSRFYRC